MELLLSFQQYFPGFLLFSLTGGALFGLSFGVFFGSADGIVLSRWHRILSGMGYGALVGAIGGAIGFFLAQGAFFLLGELWTSGGESAQWIGYPLTRALGWALLGAFVGASEGLRSWRWRRILTGVLGGGIGGALGGALLEYLRLWFPDFGLAPLVGLILYGLLLGLFYGLVESRMAYGILRLLNGKYKGKEFVINQRNMLLGTEKKSDILLTDYASENIAYARIQVEGNDLYLSPAQEGIKILVNDEPIEKKLLKYEDVIKVGRAKFYFKHEGS